MGIRTKGLALAAGAAGISGIAVFLNGYGVKAVPDATVYTTAKNLVAALLLALVAAATAATAATTDRASRQDRPAIRPARLAGLVTIGVVGGSVPFVLFFEGLARASSTQAAFLHKTLVIWVALLAVPLLAERLGPAHYAAIALLITGQAVLGGGVTALRAGTGELMVLAATLLWAAEVIIAKRLLPDVSPATLGLTRMGLGSAVLLAWLAVTGRFDALVGLGATGWWWASLTGVILAGYVATWFRALALAPAVDVTAVLVVAAIVTGLLNVAVKGTALTASSALGMVLLACGGAAVVLGTRRGVAVTR